MGSVLGSVHGSVCGSIRGSPSPLMPPVSMIHSTHPNDSSQYVLFVTLFICLINKKFIYEKKAILVELQL